MRPPLTLALLTAASCLGWARLPEGVTFREGPINSVVIARGSEQMALYRDRGMGPAQAVLLTHARRDLVESVRALAEKAELVVAPEKSRGALTRAEAFWQDFWDKRFNYYAQQVNKVPRRSLKVDRFVNEGDTIRWQGIEFQVMETEGYTRDAVCYLANIGGQRIAFTGDLLWQGGRVFDLYSFQEAIPEAQIGGYHGYGGRLAQWIESLEKLAAWRPDVLVPARGPLIEDPSGDIATAIARARSIYGNYLSTNALHWYFGKERLTTAGRRVLGADAQVELMPFAEHVALPPWCQHMGTTKLLVSRDGHGFVLDTGGDGPHEMLRQALRDGLIKKIEGIWVTHLHNDHTRNVPAAAAEFGCPVYAVAEVADGLRNPGSWFLPGIIPDPVDRVVVKNDGETWSWREFKLTSHFFPGQMYNHGGLLVERGDHKPVFFIGDSFSPSGIDDYCLMNRNLMREDTGYFLCLRKVRALPQGSWLVNQHIPHLFRFNGQELDYLEKRYRERAATIAELTPWDDVNYAIDEEWAWFYPYGSEAGPGQQLDLEVRLWNHSNRKRTFELKLQETSALKPLGEVPALTLGARSTGTVKVPLLVSKKAGRGVHVMTAGLRSEGIVLNDWIETLVKVSR